MHRLPGRLRPVLGGDPVNAAPLGSLLLAPLLAVLALTLSFAQSASGGAALGQFVPPAGVLFGPADPGGRRR
jgi:hypothetical protein